jgi:LacI family transcriptional regulator
MNSVPKVILQIEASTEYGRALLLGIARYSQLHGPWEFYREFPVAQSDREKHGPWESHKRLTVKGGGTGRLVEIKKAGFDAIITRDSEELEELKHLGLPCIIVADRYNVDALREFTAIFSDDEMIGTKAAEYFINRGYKNFGYCGVDELLWSRDRCKSFVRAVKAADIDAFIYKRPKSKAMCRWPHERQLLAEWLNSLPKPVAVMTCNDERGQQVVSACKTAGLTIPSQVSVLGVDNDGLACMLSSPPLSSITLNATSMGYEAARLLGHILETGENKNNKLYVQPTGVVTRQSSDFLAVGDEHVSLAVQYIRSNAKNVIQVADVVDQSGISRRALERKFNDKLRLSIFQEIRRARVEHIAKIISHTEMTISEIAIRLGYSSAEHIARFFKKEMGMSPSDYRKNAMVSEVI